MRLLCLQMNDARKTGRFVKEDNDSKWPVIPLEHRHFTGLARAGGREGRFKSAGCGKKKNTTQILQTVCLIINHETSFVNYLKNTCFIWNKMFRHCLVEFSFRVLHFKCRLKGTENVEQEEMMQQMTQRQEESLKTTSASVHGTPVS